MKWGVLVLVGIGFLGMHGSVTGPQPQTEVASAGAESPRKPTPVERSDWHQDLIWMNEHRTAVVFLSADLLRNVSLENLPLDDNDRLHIRWTVKDAASGRRPSCVPSRSGGAWGTAEELHDIAGIIGMFEMSFVGTVLSVEPGWSPWFASVGKLATVRIDSIIHQGEHGSFASGDEVRLLYRGGKIRFEGVDLCEFPPEGLYVPQVGDTVLATGRSWWDPSFFDVAATFKVEEGMVLPEPFANLDPHAIPRPVALIQDQVHKELRKEEMDP